MSYDWDKIVKVQVFHTGLQKISLAKRNRYVLKNESKPQIFWNIKGYMETMLNQFRLMWLTKPGGLGEWRETGTMAGLVLSHLYSSSPLGPKSSCRVIPTAFDGTPWDERDCDLLLPAIGNSLSFSPHQASMWFLAALILWISTHRCTQFFWLPKGLVYAAGGILLQSRSTSTAALWRLSRLY